MIDRAMVYEILYALAACNGRADELFGDEAPLATRAVSHSLAGKAFPEVWFELPLTGEPWFDLHLLTSRATLDPSMTFRAEDCGGHPELFAWFARQRDVRQLALSYDLSAGRADDPAVQLLVNSGDPEPSCGFLEAAGRPEMVPAYRLFRERMPEEWYACYTGVFPGRGRAAMHVECIVERERQKAYAQDPALIEADLRQAGFDALGETIVERCHLLACTPFPLEFQIEVMPDGTTGDVLGASVRFDCPPGRDDWPSFEEEGAGGALMRQLEDWGLADGRWHRFSEMTFAKRVSFRGESVRAFIFPAFVKLRWRAGEPLDAKAYFMAGLQ